MASINQVPEVLNDFRVYEEGSDNCLGVAKVELPSESVMTQTVKGVGIAGEVEAPAIGHYPLWKQTYLEHSNRNYTPPYRWSWRTLRSTWCYPMLG